MTNSLVNGIRFEDLLDKGKTQVFLFTCPGNIPFSFGSHPWFVTNKRGVIARWEILFRKNASSSSWGHLHLNFLPPSQGLGIFPYFEKRFAYRSKLIRHVEGEIAERMIEVIENSPQSYPYKFKFLLTGPNSNTYAAWVLKSFPESGFKLPWNAFGKNYN